MENEKYIKDFIKKYNLEKLPLYDGEKYVGYLDANLAYTKGHFYYLINRQAELNVAEKMLPIIENVINIWNKPITVSVGEYVDYQWLMFGTVLSMRYAKNLKL